jgi:hypothetical protein
MLMHEGAVGLVASKIGIDGIWNPIAVTIGHEIIESVAVLIEESSHSRRVLGENRA